MKSINLIFGIHYHVPVESNDCVFEKVYQNSYKPFLSILNNFPDYNLTCHYSGILLEWLEKNHPEYILLLKEMYKRKQVELLSGGFYEPIFSLIPNSDKLGQIEMLTTYIRVNFGERPRGLWLTEQVWEPSFASILKNSGMKYFFLNDSALLAAGIPEKDIYYPYMTEDQGKTVTVFPLDNVIKKLIPRDKPQAVIKYLADLADHSGERVVSFIDDGESLVASKSPANNKYKEKWITSFLKLWQENREWIISINPQKYLNQYRIKCKVYFPCNFSAKMSELLFPAYINKRPHTSLKNNCKQVPMCYGFFRQFLSKYNESNFLYSKMIYTHILVNQIRGDKYKKKAASEELWKGQCHSIYWHGNHLGIYSNSLRKKAYKNLIAAELLTRIKGIFMPSIISTDFDMDGKNEYLYQGNEMNVYIHSNGGSIIELDYLPVCWNYLDTLCRRAEFYYTREHKLKGLDWYLRKAFIDHFFPENVNINEFDKMNYKERGDFVNSNYNLIDLDREHNRISLARDGTLTIGKKNYGLRIEKKYKIKKKIIEVDYLIKNLSNLQLNIRFGVEINLSLNSRAKENMALKVVSAQKQKEISTEKQELQDTKEVIIADILNRVNIRLEANKEFLLWSLPIETIAKNDNVIESIYQASCFVPQWSFSIEEGGEWKLKIYLELSRPRSKINR